MAIASPAPNVEQWYNETEGKHPFQQGKCITLDDAIHKHAYDLRNSSCSTGGDGGRFGSRWRLQIGESGNWLQLLCATYFQLNTDQLGLDNSCRNTANIQVQLLNVFIKMLQVVFHLHTETPKVGKSNILVKVTNIKKSTQELQAIAKILLRLVQHETTYKKYAGKRKENTSCRCAIKYRHQNLQPNGKQKSQQCQQLHTTHSMVLVHTNLYQQQMWSMSVTCLLIFFLCIAQLGRWHFIIYAVNMCSNTLLWYYNAHKG